MTWSVEWDERARKELRRLDPGVQRQILEYVRDRVATDDPRRFGRPLRGTMHGLWRYRIGSYRPICQIEDGRLVVLVVAVAHRRHIYE